MSAGDRGGGFGGQQGDIQIQEDTVFIQGLNEEVTQEQLAMHFGQIGVVKVCHSAIRM